MVTNLQALDQTSRIAPYFGSDLSAEETFPSDSSGVIPDLQKCLWEETWTQRDSHVSTPYVWVAKSDAERGRNLKKTDFSHTSMHDIVL